MQLIIILVALALVPTVFLIAVYVEFLYKQNHHSLESSKKLKLFDKTATLRTIETSRKRSNTNKSSSKKTKRWKSEIKELFELGKTEPMNLYRKLSNDDIFGTLSFPNSSLTTCPEESERFDFPDITNRESVESFVMSTSKEISTLSVGTSNSGPKGFSFLFYQHLRKAGGTGFCDLARSNLGGRLVPPYYCMPDNKGSLATPPWEDTEYLVKHIQQKNFRIVGNEWDRLLDKHLNITSVVLATTIRHPIDRWYSQYRFEHLEHRDGRPEGSANIPFLRWYQNNVDWEMGRNYYIKTFVGYREPDDYEDSSRNVKNPSKKRLPDYQHFYWSYQRYRKLDITYQHFEKALFNLRQFHVILIMEWLSMDASVIMIQKILKWKTPPRQVLPHEVQAVRKNKKSLPAKDIMSESDYNVLITENIFDLLFFYIAKRIYVERFLCMK